MHVLIVSNDANFRTALSDAAGATGVDVDIVDSLDTAMNTLARSAFPLIFVQQPPRSTAPDAIPALLRATPGGAESRLVAISSSKKAARHELSQAGFDDIVETPIAAEQVACQIAQASRMVVERELLRRRVEQLDVVNTLTFNLSRSSSAERQAQQALLAISELYPDTRGAVWLRSEDGTLVHTCSFGLSPAYAEAARPTLQQKTPLQWAELVSRPRFSVVMERPPAGDPHSDLAAAEGFAASLEIGLVASSGVLGMLALYLGERMSLPDDEMTLLETIGATLAMAIAGSRPTSDDRRQPAETGETYGEIFEHLPDPIFVHDADGHFVLSNPAMLALSAYPASQLEQHTIYELFSGDDVELIGDQVSYLFHLATSENPTFTVIGPLPVDLVRSDQRLVHADLYLRSLRLPHLGNDVYIQGIVRDVSENERVRQELNANQAIVRVMAESDDLDAAMKDVWEILTQFFGYTRGGIWTVSPDGSELIPRAGVEGFGNSPISVDRGIIGRVARERRGVFVRDVASDPEYLGENSEVVSKICVPIVRDERIIGVIDVEADAEHPLEDRDLGFLHSLATQLAGMMERVELHEHLERQASTDLVTRLPNRQAFQRRLDEAIADGRNGKVSILIIGVDNFKGINELYGHLVADDLLRQIAQTLGSRINDTQLVARYTSDTFTILLPGTNREHAVTIAENLRIAIAMQLYMAAEQVEQITVSVGAATYPDDAASAQELLQAADHAMYLAKRAGKNQTFQSNKAFATLAPHHGRITDLLRQSPKETLSMLVRAMDQRLPERKGHSERVTRYAMAIARELNLPDNELPRLRLAAYIHDIGMVTLPDSLLRKPGRLSEAEREQLRNVPLEARDLLAQLDVSDSTRLAVVHQRENWDGTGHPDNLRGQQIPIGARIIAVADAIDAMTSVRAHREPMLLEEAIEQVMRQAGTQFDPEVAAAARVLSLIFSNASPHAGPVAASGAELAQHVQEPISC